MLPETSESKTLRRRSDTVVIKVLAALITLPAHYYRRMQMPLTEDQCSYLTKVLDACEVQHDKITKWETDFISDQRARWEEHGANIRLSDKQWTVIGKIGEKVGL